MWLLISQIRQRHAAYVVQSDGKSLGNNLNVTPHWEGDTRGNWKRMPYRLATLWLSHFHISCTGDEKTERESKNTSTPLLLSGGQTASSARISPSQAIMSHWRRPASCVMETSHDAVQWLVQCWRAGLALGPRRKDHTFRQLLVLLADSLMLPLRILPPRLLQARLWSSHISLLMPSKESRPRWLAAPPVSHLYHRAVDYNCWKRDSLLHLDDMKFCRSEMKISTAPHFSTA